MRSSSQLEIDLNRLEANLGAVRELVGPGVKVCGVVKADAYGLGAATIGQHLASRGIDMLAAYSHEQAAELVRVGIDRPILVLMPVRSLDRGDPLYRAAACGKLHLSIHDVGQIASLERSALALGCQVAVHLHLDTGMSRGGLTPERFAEAAAQVLGSRGLRLAGVYTHFASAEEDTPYTAEQMQRFDAAVTALGPKLPREMVVHVANTAAAHRHQRFHRTMIRVGLCLLGYGPSLVEGDSLTQQGCPAVKPIVRWRTRLVHLERFPRGVTVGYNRTLTLQRDSVLGVVPVGYADGYPLALSNKGMMELVGGDGRHTAVPVAGKVNMDQIVLDLTDAPANDVQLGGEVLLISDDPQSPCCVERLAELAGSSCYEVLCRLSGRLPRVYAYR